jgi:hypothetical protein
MPPSGKIIRIVSPTPDSKKSIVSFLAEVAEGGVSEFGKVIIGIESIGHHRMCGSHRTEYIPRQEAVTHLLLDLIHFERLIDGGDASLPEILLWENVFHDRIVFLNEADTSLILSYGDQKSTQAAFGVSSNVLTGRFSRVGTPQICDPDFGQRFVRGGPGSMGAT